MTYKLNSAEEIREYLKARENPSSNTTNGNSETKYKLNTADEINKYLRIQGSGGIEQHILDNASRRNTEQTSTLEKQNAEIENALKSIPTNTYTRFAQYGEALRSGNTAEAQSIKNNALSGLKGDEYYTKTELVPKEKILEESTRLLNQHQQNQAQLNTLRNEAKEIKTAQDTLTAARLYNEFSNDANKAKYIEADKKGVSSAPNYTEGQALSFNANKLAQLGEAWRTEGTEYVPGEMDAADFAALKEEEQDFIRWTRNKYGEEQAKIVADVLIASARETQANEMLPIYKNNPWLALPMKLLEASQRNIEDKITGLTGNYTENPSVSELTWSKYRGELSGIGGAIYDLIDGIGYMAPDLILGAAMGGAGVPAAALKVFSGVTSFLRSKGNAYEEAMRNGYSKEQANTYSNLVGATEGTMEYFLNGITALGGSPLKGFGAKLLNSFNSSLAKTALSFGGTFLKEGAEEGLQELIDPLLKNIAFNENNEINPFSADVWYSFLIGGLTGAVIESPNLIGSYSGEKQVKKAAGESIKKAGQELDIINAGLSMPTDTEAHQNALNLYKQTLEGKEISAEDIGNEAQLIYTYGEENDFDFNQMYDAEDISVENLANIKATTGATLSDLVQQKLFRNVILNTENTQQLIDTFGAEAATELQNAALRQEEKIRAQEVENARQSLELAENNEKAIEKAIDAEMKKRGDNAELLKAIDNINNYAKKRRLKVRYEFDKSDNADNGSITGNVVTVNLASDTNEQSIAIHEFLHDIKRTDAKAANRLYKAILSLAKKEGLSNYAETVKNEYLVRVPNADIEAEVTGKLVEKLLKNPDKILIEAQKNKTFGRQMLDFVAGLKRKIKNVFGIETPSLSDIENQLTSILRDTPITEEAENHTNILYSETLNNEQDFVYPELEIQDALKLYNERKQNDKQNADNYIRRIVNKTNIETLLDLPIIKETQTKVDKMPFTIDTLNETQRKNRAERAKRILNERGSYQVDNEGKGQYNGEVRKDHILHIVIGPPAAGKSSISDPISQEYKSRLVDSDEVKKLLEPEFKGGEGANAVHEESSAINDEILTTAFENGENIVLPIVGKTVDGVRKIVLDAKESGYKVYLILNELDIEKATKRAIGRFFTDNRFLSPMYVMSVGDKPTQTYEIIKKEGIIDGYARYNNDVPLGTNPQEIESEGTTLGNIGGNERTGRDNRNTTGRSIERAHDKTESEKRRQRRGTSNEGVYRAASQGERGVRQDGYISNEADETSAFSLPKTQKSLKIEGDEQASPKTQKKDNPVKIAYQPKEAALTTPKVKATKNIKKGAERSEFYKSLQEQGMTDDTAKEIFADDKAIEYYEPISNAKTLNEAFENLKGGESEVKRWFRLSAKEATAADVAEGFILLKRYQDVGDYEGMQEVARKLGKMGREAGRTVQAFSILSKLTPEGMVAYVQGELDKAFEIYSEKKSAEWIKANKDKYQLTSEDIAKIQDIVNKASALPNGREKAILLAQISEIANEKLPRTASEKLKTLQRISMLFNPKTMIRNVVGNIIMAAPNAVSDFIGAAIDKGLSRKTNTRTTGTPDVKSIAKGFGKGVFETFDDFRNHVHTRNIEQTNYEIEKGSAFVPSQAKNAVTKKLSQAVNALDRLTSAGLELGDRPFFEAYFLNSLNSQLKLNKATQPTAEMIEIATKEALERTWQDQNKATKAAGSIRRVLNLGKNFGLGDAITPFTMTPANLMKAVYEFSPAGLITVLTKDVNNFKKAVESGEGVATAQKRLTSHLSKAITGTLISIIGGILKGAGVISGGGDEDKDVRNFERYVLGIQPYSIKIGDKTYTYTWAEPIGTLWAMAADMVDGTGGNIGNLTLSTLTDALSRGGNTLFDMSMLQSLQELFSKDIVDGIVGAVVNIPSQFFPAIIRQTAQVFDENVRNTYTSGDVFSSAYKNIIASIPGASKTLTSKVNVMGDEITRGNFGERILNAYLNPANTASDVSTEAAKEIYRVYKETGNKNVIPITAPYYVTSEGKKIMFTDEQIYKYQTISGETASELVDELINTKEYKNMNEEEKAYALSLVSSYANAKAKSEVLDEEINSQYSKMDKLEGTSVAATDYIAYKTATEGETKDEDKITTLTKKYGAEEGLELFKQIEKYAYSVDDFSKTQKEKVEKAKEYGYSDKDFINAYNATRMIEGEKDKDGKTISGTKKQNQLEAIMAAGYTWLEANQLYSLVNGYEVKKTYGTAPGGIGARTVAKRKTLNVSYPETKALKSTNISFISYVEAKKAVKGLKSVKQILERLQEKGFKWTEANQIADIIKGKTPKKTYSLPK